MITPSFLPYPKIKYLLLSAFLATTYAKSYISNNESEQFKVNGTTPIEFNAAKLRSCGSLNCAGLPLRKPPRADGVMNFGYNIFLGETPEEQRSHMEGGNPKLFCYTGGLFSNSKFRKYDQLSELFTSAYCESQSESSTAASVNSDTMLKWQNSAILGQETHFSDGDVFSNFAGRFLGRPEQISTISGATLYGNTANSILASASFEAGYSFAFNKYALQKLYSATNDFSSVNTWTRHFLKATRDLGTRPSTMEVLRFFANWGTHGIEKGAFGERCESTIFMTGGASMSLYAAAMSDIEISAELSWFAQEASFTSLNDLSGSFDSGLFNYKISNRVCRGKVAQPSPCAQSLPAFGFDEPDLLQWTYKALWDMDIPRLNRAARDRMKKVASEIQAAGEECGVKYCNEKGACTPKTSTWNALGNDENDEGRIDFSQFWDPTRCFCYDDYIGEHCERGYMLMSFPFSYYFDGCPSGAEVSRFFCESAAKILGGEGSLNIIDNNMLGLPYGCSIDPDTKEIFYNTGKTGWAYSTTQQVCKKVYTILERTPETNCIRRTEVGFEECAHAAAFSSDAYTCGTCSPSRVFDPSLPPGCSIGPSNTVYYNDDENGINDGSFAAICYDKMVELEPILEIEVDCGIVCQSMNTLNGALCAILNICG